MKEFDYSNENIVKTINKNYFRRNKLLKKIIEKLSDDNNDIKSICINAPWGTGKTVFVHQLKYLINNQDKMYDLKDKLRLSNTCFNKRIKCYYFNSWENDSINLPTLSLLYNVLKDESWASAEFKDKINNLTKNVVNLLIRILSRGTLGLNELKTSNSSTFDEIFSTNKIKEEFNRAIDEYLEINRLEKLIIILDELDRCRPDYAVNMLESIKHFYNNDKLIFIISTDLIQLSHTIKKFYGDNYDSDLYLQRFFNRIVTLDMPNYQEYILYEFSINLTNKSLELDFILIDHFIKKLNMSVREINAFLSSYNRIRSSLNRGLNGHLKIAFSVFVIFGNALKIKNVSKYTNYLLGKLTNDDFRYYFNENQVLLNLINDTSLQIISTEAVFDYLYDIYTDIFLKYNSGNLKYLTPSQPNKIISLLKYEI